MSSRRSSEVKAEALRLGFFACGIAKAAPVDKDVATRFRQWIRNGSHADMQYMANHTDARLDPRLLMEGVKSIVCVAMNYTPAHRLSDNGYQLSAYVYGKDYHDVMKVRLHALAARLGFIHYRAFCDTAPVLERYWAVKAGLGWTGKHHQLIIPGAGSMFFLGELFTDEVFDYDSPVADRCGRCTRCIEACPTGVLGTTFNCVKCLSYQTIENRNELSPEAARHMGNTIYGCDRCLQACPWLRTASPTTIPEFAPTEKLLSMTKERWHHLTEEDYRYLFKGSAVKRAKYTGLMRNIQAVRENNQDCDIDTTPDSPNRPSQHE